MPVRYSQVCPPGTASYTIRSGDTFYSLARRYGTTVAALISANPEVDYNNLQAGQQICIPGQPTYPACPEGNFYTIRRGDTFYAISRRYNVSLDDLREANPGVDPNQLFIGQVICIPLAVPPVTCPAGTTAYTIRRGDTFYSIARRYNISVNALIRANPDVDPDALLVGQLICIPSTAPPPTCPSGTTAYTIRQGDTLYAIARRYNTTVNAILRANPGLDPESLQVARIICIPTAAPPFTCPSGTVAYTIRQGDTLYAIARRYNTTVNAILRANPGLDPESLQVARIICIPQ